VIGTLGFDGWAVTFGTARKKLGGAAATNGQCRPSNFVLFLVIIIIIIIIINEKINVAFSRRTARTRNSHKNKNRENVVSNSTEEKK